MAVQSLKDVSQNCLIKYTNFPNYYFFAKFQLLERFVGLMNLDPLRIVFSCYYFLLESVAKFLSSIGLSKLSSLSQWILLAVLTLLSPTILDLWGGGHIIQEHIKFKVGAKMQKRNLLRFCHILVGSYRNLGNSEWETS